MPAARCPRWCTSHVRDETANGKIVAHEHEVDVPIRDVYVTVMKASPSARVGFEPPEGWVQIESTCGVMTAAQVDQLIGSLIEAAHLLDPHHLPTADTDESQFARRMGASIMRQMHAVGLKQVELAQHLGITQPEVSALLNGRGRRMFTVMECVTIAEAIGAPLSELLEDVESY